MALTADQATKMAPVALAGVVLAGAFAVIAYLAPVGDVSEVEVIPDPVDVNQRNVDFQADWPEADWPAISDELTKLNHLRDPDGAETPETPEQAQPPEGEAPSEDEKDPDVVRLTDLKMLGAITVGERVVALVESGDAQRFVSPGDVVGRYEIRRVGRDHIVIDVSGEEKKLELSASSDRDLRVDQQYLRNRDQQIDAQEQRMRELQERRQRLLEDRPDPSR